MQRALLEKDKLLNRGRRSQKKSKVLVMVESVPVEGETTKKGEPRKVGHLKMLVIDDLKAKTINHMVNVNISKSAVIDSDHSTSYLTLNPQQSYQQKSSKHCV